MVFILTLTIGKTTKKVLLKSKILKAFASSSYRYSEKILGMVLGDAGIFKKSKKSGIKFSQSFQQKDFLFHLFTLWDLYTFMEMGGQRLDHKSQTIKSFWFKTFSHYSLNLLWENFYKNGKKVLPDNLILNSLTPLGFAYWIMCDGSMRIQVVHSTTLFVYVKLRIKASHTSF